MDEILEQKNLLEVSYAEKLKKELASQHTFVQSLIESS